MIQADFKSLCLPILCFGLHLAAAVAGASEFVYSGFAGANLTVDGTASVTPGGLLELTTGAVINEKGHAFHPTPLPLRESPDGKTKAVRSFSASFVFGVVPTSSGQGGHGIALVVTPTKNFSSGLASSYLGLLNSTIGSDAYHMFAVELDTIASPEFADPNNNHVGIDINSLKSTNVSDAGYYDDNTGEFKSLTLVSGQAMQVWLDYDEDTTQIDVALALAATKKPSKPLVSSRFDLSSVITNKSYIGFSSSTGQLRTRNIVLGWSFGVDRPAPAINMAKLAKLPDTDRSSTTQSSRTMSMVIALPIVSVVLVLFMVATLLLVLRRRYRYVELREDWEVEFGAHRVSYKDLHIATEGFKNKNLLGTGGFGRVYKGVLPTSCLEVAVKRVSHESSQGMKEFVAEVASIGHLRHRNLVQLLGYCRLKDELLLVYDYMPNGSLDKYLYGHDEKPALSWAQRFRIINGVASGLLYLHEEWEQVVVHRDVKASNVLLDGEMNARLGDFGLARLHNRDAELHTTVLAGTFGYMAPELALTGRSSPLTDVFAFGAFVLEVTTGRRPIEQNADGGNRLMLVDWVFDHWLKESLVEAADPRLGGDYDTDEVSLALRVGLLCSHPMASARPSMRQVMQYLDGDVPPPELTRTHLSFSMLTLMQNQGFDSYVSSSSLKSLGTISNISTGR